MSGIMNTAVGGMSAQSQRMASIGNNIANSSTVAYKGNRVSFQENYFYSTLQKYENGQRDQIGSGVNLAGTMNDWSNSAIEETSQMSHIALQGDGFFVVQKSGVVDENGAPQNLFSRDGNFAINEESYTEENGSGMLIPKKRVIMMRPDGSKLVGSAVDPASGQTVNGVLKFGYINDAGDFVNAAPTEIQIGPNGEVKTQGVALDGTEGNTADGDASNDAIRVAIETNSGETFMIQGKDDVERYVGTTVNNAVDVNGNVVASGDVTGIQDTADFGWVAMLDTTGDGTGDTQVVPTNLPQLDTDADATASLRTVTQDIWLPVKNFVNPDSMKRMGAGNYSNIEGDSIAINQGGREWLKPGEGGTGTMKQGGLEESNVDLVKEFTDMIKTQRAYQANSKTISTVDQMQQQVLGLVR